MPSSKIIQAHHQYLDARTFGSLDGVRGLCILAVIWHHASPELPALFFSRGFLGVDMFFVLSGFLIVTLLLRERDRTGAISLKKFYARRTLRIFPIYYLVIFGVLFLYLVTRPFSASARSYYACLPFLATYTSNWVKIQAGNVGISWSLATEEQFYLGWPLVEKLLKPAGVAVVLALVLIVNQFINFGFFDGLFMTIYGARSELPVLSATFTPIALGVLLAHLLHERRSYAVLSPLLGRRGSWMVPGGLLLVLIAGWPGDISGMGRLLIQLSMMLVLGSFVIREDHSARRLLAFRPLAYLGVISYGLYLYHMWAIHPVRVGFLRFGMKLDSIAFFLAALIASTIVAGLSYRFIEQPFLRMKSRFASDAPTSDAVGVFPRIGSSLTRAGEALACEGRQSQAEPALPEGSGLDD